jgi:hypothetical protein
MILDCCKGFLRLEFGSVYNAFLDENRLDDGF